MTRLSVSGAISRAWRHRQEPVHPVMLQHWPQRVRTSRVRCCQSPSVAMMSMARRVIRGVVFDMDGTITIPVIDFALMRRKVGILTGDILDVINTWPEAEQTRAYQAIAELEEQALIDMKLMPGVVELCGHLDQQRVPRGLITRNVRKGVDYLHRHHFPLPAFEPAITRECPHPYKPSPSALLHICSTWGISPAECVMIGDSAKDDVVSGNAAGAVTILIDSEGRYTSDSQLHGQLAPSHKVPSMADVMAILTQHYELLPPEQGMR